MATRTAYLIAYLSPRSGRVRRVSITSEWPHTQIFTPGASTPALVTQASSETSYMRARSRLVAQVRGYPHLRWLWPYLERDEAGQPRPGDVVGAVR